MAKPKYLREFISYANDVLHDSFEGLDWKQLLEWLHRHFKFTKGKLPKPRAELPIDIIIQAKGRCGEFALLYNGLLLANGYQTRLIVDCSTLQDRAKKVAGDHVWVELFINDGWIHVDPTEKRINEPLMYALGWNKDVNLVYAITDEEIVDVTKTYQPKDKTQ
jgi:transglutaminase-like putative cysteine protease